MSSEVRRRLAELAEGASVEVAPADVLDDNNFTLPSRVYVNMIRREASHFEDVAAAVSRCRALGVRTVVPHVPAARFHSVDHAHNVLQDLASAGASACLVLGGDDGNDKRVFADAMALLKAMPLPDTKSVAVAGYPEGHPRLTRPLSAQLLRAKCEFALSRGFDVVRITTQFTLDTHALVTWLRATLSDLRPLFTTSQRLHVDLGIPGPTPWSTLLRIADLCRVHCAGPSAFFRDDGTTRAVDEEPWFDPTAQLLAIADFCERANLPPGDVNVHFFAFGGGLPDTLRLLARLRDDPCSSLVRTTSSSSSSEENQPT